ncbi:MAG: GAF domain-containing protein [Chloroflexi bacterium]|nr:GAF domain-containing protein [Chloroflexota bacterium]
MRRKPSIQTQLVLTVVFALIVLATTLQVFNSFQQRDALIDTHREQSLALATSLRTDWRTMEPAVLEEELVRVAENSDTIAFIALIAPDNRVVAHSDPLLTGEDRGAVDLDNLPVDQSPRQNVIGFDDVYLTTVSMPVSATGAYNLVIASSADPIDDKLRTSLWTAVWLALGLTTLFGGITLLVLWLNVKRPLRTLLQGVDDYAQGRLAHGIPSSGSAEIRDLVSALNQMATHLHQSRTELQTQYQAAERQAEDRARDMRISAEIGRIATSLRDVNVLMRETVEQICRRFEAIYHAQVFLLDDVEEYAVLVESTGNAGRTLLDLNHKLAVGSSSLIGRVTARGQTIIASDTRHAEVPWQPNPVLPDTRAEMALPLRIEGRVIGALDVQSASPDVFTDEMVQVFQILADQLAIAIANARLLAESDQRVLEIRELNRQLTRSSWQEYLESQTGQEAVGYLYDHNRLAVLDPDGLPQLAPAHTEAAIQVRGETVGTLAATLPDGEELSEDDQILVEAVADRVALAIENARLFQRTQRALAETERLYDTARAVSSASELNAIYQLVIEQLSMAADVDHIDILLSGPDPALVQYLETVYAWHRDGQDGQSTGDGTGERLPLLPLSYADSYAELEISVPILYNDVEHEMSPNHPLYQHLVELGMRSAVLAPLNAGGRWFGMLVCLSHNPGGFEPGYVTFGGALADQLAIAIENRRLFEEAQTEARRARALAEAGQLASQIGGNYEAGLQSLFQAVSGPGHYDRWWFGLLNDDGTQLVQVAASEIVHLPDVSVEQDQNALAEAARIGEIVLINDPTDHPVISEESYADFEVWGKHIAMPVKIGGDIVGVMQLGRALNEPNLDERDIQLAATLASQVAVATQNRQLFSQAESERQNLQTIVDTMPTGILVMDRQGRILLSNERLRELLGPAMRPGNTENVAPYTLVRTGTTDLYPRAEWPITRVFNTEEPALVDDMAVLHPDGTEISLLAQAAPIRDVDGVVRTVVGAFQDITELQELEKALQDSLRETTMLYEASRSISRAMGMDNLLKVTTAQVATLAPDKLFIYLRHDVPGAEPFTALEASHPDDEDTIQQASLLMPLLSNETLLVQQATAPAHVIDRLQQTDLATVASFPLSVRGQVTGWIVVGFSRAYHLTIEQRRLMTTLADQAAVTIENQRLLTRSEEALQNTAVLYHASRAIAEAETPSDILQTIVNYAAPPPITQAYLYMLLSDSWDDPRAAVEIIAAWNFDETDDLQALVGTRYPVAELPIGAELALPEITGIDDITQATTLSPEAREGFAHLAMQAVTIMPLRVAGRPLGTIVIGMDTAWQHTATELRTYQSLSDQAAVSLANTQLYQQIQRRARQLSASAEVSRAVTSILEMDRLLPQVVNLIRDTFGYDHAQIFLLSPDGGQANLVASTGEAGQQLLSLEHSLPVGSRSVIGQVTASGQPVVALDTADARVVHRPNPLLPDTRSEMALPLIARGHILGALDVQSNQSGAFTDEDTRVLAALADQVATAIDNARLFELSEQRAEEMEFLFSVTTAATTSPNLDEALEQAVATLRETMDVTRASIYLPDEQGEYMLKGAGVGATDVVDTSSVSIDRGLIGWVARHEEAVIINDMAEDPRRLPEPTNTQSAIAVPLRTASGLVGVLIAESEQLNAFDDGDLRLLQTLSGSLAAIIQNSRLLREMQEANERLMEVDRLKTNFLAAMSHELRTPLNSIIGFSRVILKGIDGPLTDTQEQDLTTIYESGKHLLGLVNDILDQAKLEAGKMDLSFAPFRVQEVIKGVMSTAIGLTRDAPIELRTELAPDLPDAYGDEFRTRQVLLNLVSNASKFTMQGSITVSAQVIQENDHDFIEVTVADTGIGIAEKDMPLLFEAFQQVDNSTTRSVEGTGMGLPLAKSLTELQGGRIWVESQPAVGSTFGVTIPTGPLPSQSEDPDADQTGLMAGHDVPATDSAAAVSEPAPVQQFTTRIVLAIEKDPEVINLYYRYLSRAGYEIMGATHPDEARQLITTFQPCAVLLDVNMPDQNGWQVLEDLATSVETAGAPVVVCSLSTETDRAFEVGAWDYIMRPFTEQQIIDVVRRAELQAKRQHILLVDDKPESVRAFRQVLEDSQQYRITEVTTGEQALEVLERAPRIDLVILDLRMPEIDGFEVLQAMRTNEHTTHIPVLVLTAEDLAADERVVLEAIDVYRKDALDEDHLLQHVAAHLGNGQEKK